MKTFYLILYLFLFSSCKTDHEIRIGSYKSIHYNKIELGLLYVFKGINGAYSGSEIIIKSDSSFVRTTCGNIIKGSWFIKDDSLCLIEKSNRYRIDSLNVVGFKGHWPSIPLKPIKYKIENDYLINIHYANKRDKVIEKMKFNVP